MGQFPKDPDQLLEALGYAFKKKNNLKIVELLQNASCSFSYGDHFNNRCEVNLIIHLSMDSFLEADKHLNSFSKAATQVGQSLTNSDDEYFLGTVEFAPDLATSGPWRNADSPLQASTSDLQRIWQDGFFRLFVSHSSMDKAVATELKTYLKRARIHCFVAHEDIIPTTQWETEIRLALSSCHAILYLSTEASSKSVWCQQEIGWGYGRGVPVVTAKLDSDPLGFASKEQAILCKGKQPREIAPKIVDTLIQNDKLEIAFREPLTVVAQSSTSVNELLYWLEVVLKLSSLSEDQLERLARMKDSKLDWSSNKKLNAKFEEVFKKFNFSSKLSNVNKVADEYDPFADE